MEASSLIGGKYPQSESRQRIFLLNIGRTYFCGSISVK